MAKLGIHKDWPDERAYETFGAYMSAGDDKLKELQATSDALPDGEIVGGLVRWQRADGYAVYIVIADKPLTLAHVDYCDGYQVEGALIRGLRRGDIEGMLGQEKRLHAMFAESRLAS